MKLLGFVVMDNHVHLVLGLTDRCSLGELMRDFKTWTSNRNSSKPDGSPLWERRYDDNRIQTSRELSQVLKYIHGNPVRAELVDSAEQYPWSSVHNYLRNGRQLIELDEDYWEYS
jgi:putative transposase